MASLWQFTKADGDPAWPVGADHFGHVWDRAWDLLRFHRGAGFHITNRKTGTRGPLRRLGEIEEALRGQLQQYPGVVFEVKAASDEYALVFRRKVVEDDLLGDEFVDVGREFIGAPYLLGGVSPWGVDCSGLVIAQSKPFGITWSVHKAAVMWQELRAGKDGKLVIPREKIKRGDLLIIHDGDHIATYLDNEYGGRVLDAEPSSVQSPWGWTPGGVQVRSMAPNYYCAWANVNAVGRLVKINGSP